jgi:hypothetical protein
MRQAQGGHYIVGSLWTVKEPGGKEAVRVVVRCGEERR